MHVRIPIFSEKTSIDEYIGDLSSCYRSCLQVALKKSIRSIAFPDLERQMSDEYEPAVRACVETIRTW